jgi:hypothetical protein
MPAEIQWTFSQVKAFQTCPRQYLHKYVLKDIPYVQSEEAKFGDAVHEAIENLIKKQTPIPDKFKQFIPQIEPVLRWPGVKYAERKMALDSNMQPCDYYSPEYFVRGKADFMTIDGAKARCLDWKTGGNLKYAEVKQNELMALMIFKLHPEVEVVSTGLVFLMLDRVVPATFWRKDEKAMWLRWMYEVERIKEAKKRNNFGPNPSGLCKKWCDVLSCEHNGKTNA